MVTHIKSEDCLNSCSGLCSPLLHRRRLVQIRPVILRRRSRLRRTANLFYLVYLMARGNYLGEFEHLVLLALMRLGNDAYGVTVRREIEARTQRKVSIGAIYATLDRMEAKGLVRSRVGEPTAARGGRAKRHFQITSRGVTAVNRTHETLRKMSDGLAAVRSFA
jgi:PadR family transcriptional regulator PadR